MSYKINAEMLGTEATDADANRMVAILTNRGYDVEVGNALGQDETEIATRDWEAALDIVSNKYGRVVFEGATYTLTQAADFSNRVFTGWWGDAQEGEEYTVEFSCPAIDDDGNPVAVYWQFDATKGEEPALDGYPFDDQHITQVRPQ